MERLIARDAILRTVYEFIESEDDLNRELFLSLFEPDKLVTLDLSRHVGMPLTEVTPEDLWGHVMLALSGFESTHHILGNELVDFEGETLSKAHCSSKVRGYHCVKIDDSLEEMTAQGMLQIDLEVYESKWVIRKITIIRTGPMNKRELYEVARAKVQKGEGRKST